MARLKQYCQQALGYYWQRVGSREGIALLFLMVLGFAIRWPKLWEIPRFIDELREVKLAWQLANFQTFALHNVAHDIGALHNYLMAVGFGFLGANLYWPRFYVLLTSILTLPIIYLTGKRFFSPLTGWSAALLLLTNGMHILVTHMAWANCTTPFFFSLALFFTMNAEAERSERQLRTAALLWALTLQTHFSVTVYLLTLACYFGWREWRGTGLFSFRQYLRAVWFFVLGYLNMLVYNLFTLGGSLRWLHNKSYTLEQEPGVFSYLQNVGAMVVELFRTISSTYELPHFWGKYLTYPLFLLGLIVFGAGCYFAARIKQYLPLWLLAGGVLIIPWVNQRYDFYVSTRYIMPLVLCALLIAGFGLDNLWRMFFRKFPAMKQAAIPVAVLGIVLVAVPLIPLSQYYQRLNRTDMSNDLSFQIVQTVTALSKSQPVLVLLDPKLAIPNDPLPTLFTIAKIKYQVVTEPSRVWPSTALRRLERKNRNRRLLAVLNQTTYRQIAIQSRVKLVRDFTIRKLLAVPVEKRKYQKAYIVMIKPPQ